MTPLWKLDQRVTIADMIEGAADLQSEDGENPQYDRALRELIGTLAGIEPADLEREMLRLRYMRFKKWTEAQWDSFCSLQEQSGINFDELLATTYMDALDGYVAVPNFHGMFVGIEKDGYTHS